MKYVNTGVVFQEIPDEVTLSINISNCPCHCLGCHSQYLWDDIGVQLNVMSLSILLDEYGDDVTCVCFMGGDAEPENVNELAVYIRHNYPKLKVAWYSGRREISDKIDTSFFHFIKVGPYVENLGPLNSPTTNQHLYKITKGKLEDITYKFWKK